MKPTKITTREKAIAYCREVADMFDPYPCRYGHHGCATYDGGPCSDETMGEWNLDDDEV